MRSAVRVLASDGGSSCLGSGKRPQEHACRENTYEIWSLHVLQVPDSFKF
jgi:hypothetical protein